MEEERLCGADVSCPCAGPLDQTAASRHHLPAAGQAISKRAAPVEAPNDCSYMRDAVGDQRAAPTANPQNLEQMVIALLVPLVMEQ